MSGWRNGAVMGVAVGGCLLMLTAPARAQFGEKIEEIGREALKGAAIGYAVKQSAKPLNQFINTVTLRRGVKDTQTTKVVPMLSVGDKGYVGAAQVSGAAAVIGKTQAVWQIEGSKQIGDGIYRIKALVPSDSLNPLKIRRVGGVGVTAVIDVATGGTVAEGPYSRPVRGGDLIKAGAVAVAVRAAARPLNDAINAITINPNRAATRVVPMATFGEKAYIGAAQISGPGAALTKTKAVWQYEDLFDRGRFRVKILVPTDISGPTNIRRVPGVGLSALVDTTIQRQSDRLEARRPDSRPAPRPVVVPVGRPLPPSAPPPVVVDARRLPPGQAKKLGLGKPDNGKHKGWYKDKGRGRDEDEDERGEDRRGRGKGKGRREDD